MSKKITMKDLRNAIKPVVDTDNAVTILEWNGLSIEVKKHLTLEEARGLVNTVTATCFNDDGVYMPENFDPAIRFGVVGLYSNLTMFSDVSENYNLVYKTDIYDRIRDVVDAAQLKAIINAIYNKIDEVIKVRAESVLGKVNEIYAATESMQQQFADIFSGVDAGGLNKLIGAIGERGIDEGKLVRAIVEVKHGNDE